MEILRWMASLTTMAAGLVLAARVRPRLMGWAFVALTLASLAWVLIGYFAEEYALISPLRPRRQSGWNRDRRSGRTCAPS